MITGAKTSAQYLAYLYEKVRGKFTFQSGECSNLEKGDYRTLSFCVDETLCPYLRRFAEENIADVIAIGYKYDYLAARLSLPLLTPSQKRLLCVALISADLEEDREYALRRIRRDNEYSIDGVFNFRLSQLKKRWEGVLEYIPRQFGSASLDDFVNFLVEEGEGKVYVKEENVYDENYRQLTRGKVLAGADAVTEILLKGPSKVYCFGEVKEATRDFLGKYYRENAFFY